MKLSKLEGIEISIKDNYDRKFIRDLAKEYLKIQYKVSEGLSIDTMQERLENSILFRSNKQVVYIGNKYNGCKCKITFNDYTFHGLIIRKLDSFDIYIKTTDVNIEELRNTGLRIFNSTDVVKNYDAFISINKEKLVYISEIEPVNNYYNWKSEFNSRLVEINGRETGVFVFPDDIEHDYSKTPTEIYIANNKSGMKKFLKDQRKGYEYVNRIRLHRAIEDTRLANLPNGYDPIQVLEPEPENEWDKFVGKKVTCTIRGIGINDAEVSKEGGEYFILQDYQSGKYAKQLKGYTYSYLVNEMRTRSLNVELKYKGDEPVMPQEIKEVILDEPVIKEEPSDIMNMLAMELKKKMGVDNINEAKIINLVEQEVKKYHIPREIHVIKHDGSKKEVGLTHEKFEDLLKLVEKRIDTFLVGEAGSGKTTLCSNVAKALDLQFYFIPVGLQTTKSDLLGYLDANGRYVKTHLRNAYENGGVFLLDEIDAGNPNVLTIINAMLANGYASFPDAIVPRHDDFIFIGAGNTYGLGNDMQYVGRNQLDAATLDRFVVLNITYDKKLESSLVKNDSWLKEIWNIREAAKKLNEKIIVSPRASIKGEMMLESGFSLEQVKKMAVYKGINEEIVKRIEAEVARMY